MSAEPNGIDARTNENYISYYFFIFVSAIIGFIAVIFVTGAAIDRFTNSDGLSFIHNSKFILSLFVALVLTIIFVFISIILKRQLKYIFFSEFFLYLYIGVLTTAVSVVVFEIFRNMFARSGGESGAGWKVAEVLSFIIAIIFAFVTDKIIVFKSYEFNLLKIFSESSMFFGARLISEIVNIALMWFMIDVHKMNAFIVKNLASVIVIILNYLFSKFIVFKRNVKKM